MQEEYMVEQSTGLLAGLGVTLVFVCAAIFLAIAVVGIISSWKIFTKAGKEGWISIIPIYNIIILLEIIGKPTWWLILIIIPCSAPVMAVLVYLELAKVFGKSTGYGIGLLLLPIVFLPMLAFGDAQYKGPQGSPE